ncbi:MAG: DUF6580 family putative transport protein [Chitinophagaceae bacterium]|jgi:hypothetical protein
MMKLNRSFIWALAAMVLVTALYRVFPGRPYGFAPQIAVALFGGFLFARSKQYAFALPLLSMLLSDLLYQISYKMGYSMIPGFYSGMISNYLLFAAVTVVGFAIRKNNALSVTAAAVTAPTLFFLVSNFMVWAGNGGYKRPMTFDGLMLCYQDGLPFYQNSLLGTVFFSAIFFGGYYLITRFAGSKRIA